MASNVLAALVLSSQPTGSLPTARLLVVAIAAGCLIYAGGATFNDVADAKFDAQRRPERAIPRKVISRAGAAWLAGFEMVLGLVILVLAGAAATWAIALAATILLYDWIHKRWIGSVALMAGCRVLLALAIASLPGQLPSTAFEGWVGVLFVYIVTLSLIARWEYRVAETATVPVAAGVGPGAETNRAAKIGRSVGRLLAFIPLIDAVALLLVGAWIPAMACAAAVPLGRWAQRLAAST